MCPSYFVKICKILCGHHFGNQEEEEEEEEEEEQEQEQEQEQEEEQEQEQEQEQEEEQELASHANAGIRYGVSSACCSAPGG